MFEELIGFTSFDTSFVLGSFLSTSKNYVIFILGFSFIIFVHELGHFIAAKLADVRVDKFAVGFGRELFGFSRGETRYSFNVLPLGGYVKMLGQEDFAIDKSGELKVKEDPRAFTYKPVGTRMFIVSAGVIMNFIFAAFLFMLVFMIGMKSTSAKIGDIQPGMPADKAGLRTGDTIVKINGKAIRDRGDLVAAIVLSDPDESMAITYQRPDSVSGEVSTNTVSLRPEMAGDRNVLKIGVAPPMNTTVALVQDDSVLPAEEQLRPNDEILEVNDREVSSFWEVQYILADLRGHWGQLKVLRPSPEDKSPGNVLNIRRRAHLYLVPTGTREKDSGHLLGFVPRRKIGSIEDGSRANLADLRAGDVIVRWGGQLAPTLSEILDSIAGNPETDIRIEVLRGSGQIFRTHVRPRVRGVFAKSKPKVGMTFYSHESDRLVVADIVTSVTEKIATPAAKLKDKMPRGAVITKIENNPVSSWYELAERFIELAGKDVKITWQYEGQAEQSDTIHIPHSLGTTFDLPAASVITSINDVTSKEVIIDGRRMTYTAGNWIGAREILRDFIGQTVTVKYQGYGDTTEKTAQVKVTEEMLDTWMLRLKYRVEDMFTQFDITVVRELNPIKAMMIGIRKTWYFIEQVYITMKRMIFTRSMGMEQISGPVGIIKMGSDSVALGLSVMLYFMALISANLGVINFLPLPIVDGGLFIFLIIEKIKGGPISMRVQIATQIIGLALIIGIFLVVTIQDILKFAG
ncbi:MAG: site-2 protease family protein [Planctomycetota bacterium]|nr:MAG: site-2 protease family protein [Planctomycetota bacterium]